MAKKNAKTLPQVWPGYETVEELGRGSYGSVFKVRKSDASGEYFSAVKRISIPANEAEYYSLHQSGYGNEEITEIFRSRLEKIENEFRIMEEFKGDSHIVSYLEHMLIEKPEEDYVRTDILIRMELLKRLSDIYDRFSAQEVVQLGTDMCSALETIQRHGIVHRDIKPSNILYNDHLGYYKLADFGISKAIGSAGQGTMIGTIDYIAPEVYHKEAYGFQADQYSLGLVLYWALNERKLPFMPLDRVPTEDDFQNAKQRRVSGETLPPPKNGSEALKQVVLKACAADPEERYESITAMKKALFRCEEDEEPFTRKTESVAEKKEPAAAESVSEDDDAGTIGRFGAVKPHAAAPERKNSRSGGAPKAEKKEKASAGAAVPAKEPEKKSFAEPAGEPFPYEEEEDHGTIGAFFAKKGETAASPSGAPKSAAREEAPKSAGARSAKSSSAAGTKPAGGYAGSAAKRTAGRAERKTAGPAPENRKPDRIALSREQKEAVLSYYIGQIYKDSGKQISGCTASFNYSPSMIRSVIQQFGLRNLRADQVLGCIQPVPPAWQVYMRFLFSEDGIYYLGKEPGFLRYVDIADAKTFQLPSKSWGVKALSKDQKIHVFCLSVGFVQMIDAGRFLEMLRILAGFPDACAPFLR